MDDGCDPDGIVCEPIQHTVTADDDFPIAKRREFWHNATTLGEHCEALGGRQQPLNQRFGGAWRVPRDEVVDVPQVVAGTLRPSYCRHVRACSRTSSGESVRPAAMSASAAASFSRRYRR